MDESPGEESADRQALAREELQRTFEYQVQRLREIDGKAIEILKANLLLLGLVVTGGSILVQTDVAVGAFLNVFTATGIGLLLCSTGLAGITYTSSNLRGGIGAAAATDAVGIQTAADEAAYREQVLRSYGEWIEYNARVTAVNDMLATVTVLTVILAFTYIAAGFVVGVLLLPLLGEVVLFVVFSIVAVGAARVFYRMDHLSPPATTGDTYEGIMLSKGATRDDGFVALLEMLRAQAESPPDDERE